VHKPSFMYSCVHFFRYGKCVRLPIYVRIYMGLSSVEFKIYCNVYFIKVCKMYVYLKHFSKRWTFNWVQWQMLSLWQ